MTLGEAHRVSLVVHTRCCFARIIMENTSEITRKSNDKKAVKEKRKQDKFVSRYIEIKYPNIYKETMNDYKALVTKYPGRADITKTYFFKKWEAENQRKEPQEPQLYIPFLPILTELPQTTRVEVIEEGQQVEIDEETGEECQQYEEGLQQEGNDQEEQQQVSPQPPPPRGAGIPTTTPPRGYNGRFYLTNDDRRNVHSC